MTARPKDQTVKPYRGWLTVITTAAAILLAAGSSAAAQIGPALPAEDTPVPFRPPHGEPDGIYLPLTAENLVLNFSPAPSGTAPMSRAGEIMLPAGDSTGPMEGAAAFTIEDDEEQSNPLKDISADSFSMWPAETGQAEQEGELGAVTIVLDEANGKATSQLRVDALFPATVEHTLSLHFKMTIEHPPAQSGATGGTEQSEGPLVLTTKEPATLVGKLSSFPPQGEIYQLQNPIDLVDPDNPDQTVATIDQFPLQGGSK